MATALTGTVVVAPQWQPGTIQSSLGTYTLAGSVVTGDTYTFANMLPANDCIVIGFTRWGQELDTNASPTATEIWGDGTDTDAYLTSQVAGNAIGYELFEGNGALIGVSTAPASRNVVGTVGGTVATAAATGTIFVRVTYLCTSAAAII